MLRHDPAGTPELTRELAAFGDELGSVLIPESRRASMQSAADMLALARPEFAFERHLDEHDVAIDLTLRVDARGRDRLLAAHAQLPAAVERVLRGWADPMRAVHAMPFVEFEFDLPGYATEPWIGPAVEPRLRSGARVIQAERDRESGGRPIASRLFGEALELLDARPLAAGTRARVIECVTLLPKLGVLGQLARLDGRPSAPREGVRVFVSLPRSGFETYLRALDYPGSIASLQRTIDHWAPHSTWLDLDLGIHEGRLEPKIGWYLEFRAPRWASSELRRLLELLESEQQCDVRVTIALERWVKLVDARRDRVLTCKLVLDPDQAIRAKIYVSTLRSPASLHGDDQPSRERGV